MIKPEDLYINVILSLTRFVEDFRLAHMPTADLIDWDDHANIEELPEKDVIGLMGVGMATDVKDQHEVVFGIGLSTYADKGKVRLSRLISKMRGALDPEGTIQIYEESLDGLTAVKKSWMVLAHPVAVTPTSKTEVRVVQAVEARALVSPAATSSFG
ncbi:hypothetical protein CPT_Seuss18 [Caulobacter phage Seuss]|uniref:Uncharacterized protein n=1 Tax=Caulobacter phage Seuss TaxID=1675601 RepID=A0A0K1LM58_9CAUD|nr:hypothetical protein HOR08_gp018 [Caulobacter phage Seuss]AKU43544.1 hypothetical protein CPT_Seuss18 [Caulobacter phage Seuss]